MLELIQHLNLSGFVCIEKLLLFFRVHSLKFHDFVVKVSAHSVTQKHLVSWLKKVNNVEQYLSSYVMAV